MLVIQPTLHQVSAQTLKERIDEAKVVKVYFKNADIDAKLNTVTQNEPSGCENFPQTTPLTADYIEALKSIVDLLNRGFHTTAFEIGSYSAIYNKSLPSMSLDWLKIGKFPRNRNMVLCIQHH